MSCMDLECAPYCEAVHGRPRSLRGEGPGVLGIFIAGALGAGYERRGFSPPAESRRKR